MRPLPLALIIVAFVTWLPDFTEAVPESKLLGVSHKCVDHQLDKMFRDFRDHAENIGVIIRTETTMDYEKRQLLIVETLDRRKIKVQTTSVDYEAVRSELRNVEMVDDPEVLYQGIAFSANTFTSESHPILNTILAELRSSGPSPVPEPSFIIHGVGFFFTAETAVSSVEFMFDAPGYPRTSEMELHPIDTWFHRWVEVLDRLEKEKHDGAKDGRKSP